MRLWNPRGLRTLAIAAFAMGTACAQGESEATDDAGSAPPTQGDDATIDGQGSHPVDASDASNARPDSSSGSDATDATAAADVTVSDSALLDGPLAQDAPQGTDAVVVADAPADNAPPTCTGTQILCGTACVDPTVDPNHCGGCGVVCSSGLCGTTVSAPMAASPSGWSFNGSAAWSSNGPSAQMTAALAAGVTGTVVYQHAIATDSVVVDFQFRIGAGGGGRYDGMGFMMETTGATAVGGSNGGLGMLGLGGYGVEFDVYNNGQCGDSSGDHVGVDSLTACSASSTMPTSLYASADLTSQINLADGQWHSATVTVASAAMSVTVDTRSIAQNVALPGFVAGTSYYYGFSGATGGNPGNGGVQTEVKAVTLTFPTPRCL
jgi:hypothetical protein